MRTIAVTLALSLSLVPTALAEYKADLEQVKTTARWLAQEPTQAVPADIELEEVTVFGGVRRPRPQTGSKTGTPLRDLPASIQVVPKELLEEQGALDVDCSIRSVSGVQQSSSGNYGFFNNYNIRGLQQTFLRDGVPDGSTTNGYARTLAGVETIEVLKGPGSALYGTTAPGGTVNLVSERPQAVPLHSTALSFGSFGTYRGTIDLTGPLSESKDLLYRLNLNYQSKDGYRGLKSKIVEVLPVLSWKPNAFNTWTFNVDYRNIEAAADTQGIPFFQSGLTNQAAGAGAQILGVPSALRYYTPFADTRQEMLRVAIKNEWQLQPDLLWRNNLAVLDRNLFLARNAFTPLFTGNTLSGRTLREQTDHVVDLTFQSELVWDTTIGSVKNTVLAGLEYQRHGIAAVRRSARLPNITDVFNPVTPELGRSSLVYDPRQSTFNLGLRADYYTVYLQDQFSFSEQWKARVGARLDQFGIESNGTINNSAGVAVPTRQGLSTSPLSYQAGLVYQPSRTVSLYAGVSKSNLANLNTESSTLNPVENALQYELGIKTSFLGDRVNANLAFFDVTRENFVITINGEPVPVGRQGTRGVELDFYAEPLPGWKLLANYALYDAKLLKLGSADAPYEGNRAVGVPENSGSLWTTYQIQDGPLQGFGLGGGLTYKDSVFINTQNTLRIPGYTVFDAVLFYRSPRFDAQLNFFNLAGTSYYRNGVNGGALPGDPFTVQFTLDFRM